MNRLHILLILTALLLVGCGGSGTDESAPAVDDSTATTNSNNDSTNDSESESDSESEAETSTEDDEASEDNQESESPQASSNEADSNDENIDAGFNFRSVVNVDLHLDVSAISDTKSYVSLCHYQANSSTDINYEDCLVRGSTSYGVFAATFDAAPHFEQLGLVVWFIDTSIQPLQFEVSRMEMDMGEVHIVAGN